MGTSNQSMTLREAQIAALRKAADLPEGGTVRIVRTGRRLFAVDANGELTFVIHRNWIHNGHYRHYLGWGDLLDEAGIEAEVGDV